VENKIQQSNQSYASKQETTERLERKGKRRGKDKKEPQRGQI
jgi:hypothetical protein